MDSMSDPRKLPDGYHTIQPYLIFSDTPKAMAFFSRVFGATERMCMRNDGRVVHAELQIGDSVVMLADENPAIEAFSAPHYGGSPVSILVYVDNCDVTYKTALEAGAKSLREPANQPYGDRVAGILDPFGYSWWIAHAVPNAGKRGEDL